MSKHAPPLPKIDYQQRMLRYHLQPAEDTVLQKAGQRADLRSTIPKSRTFVYIVSICTLLPLVLVIPVDLHSREAPMPSDVVTVNASPVSLDELVVAPGPAALAIEKRQSARVDVQLTSARSALSSAENSGATILSDGQEHTIPFPEPALVRQRVP